MKVKSKKHQAFTLIELLVVITIIAILATVATPMMNKARMTARTIPAINNVKSILTGLTLYSGETGGLYPRAKDNANQAFRKMFESGSIDNEKMFWQQGDTEFCSLNEPDGKTDGDEALAAGENHWAYVSGLRDGDNSSTPIIADGFTGPNNTYDGRRHVWAKLNKAIVGSVDGSARAMKVEKDFTVKDPGNKSKNFFDLSVMEEDDSVQILNPIPFGAEDEDA